MLANLAHVKLGPYTFELDESIDAQTPNSGFLRPHYSHRAESLFAGQGQAVVGMVDKENVHPERLIWGWDDWSGGEGNRLFYTDEPTKYDYSDGLNGRIPGQITGRPNRVSVTGVLTTRRLGARPSFAVSQGAIWYGGAVNLGYNEDDNPATWTILTTSTVTGSDMPGLRSKDDTYNITAMCGDSEYLYYSAWHLGMSGTRALMAKKKDNTNVAGNVQLEVTDAPPYAGLSIMNGRLYAWTGRRLEEYDIAELTGDTPSALTASQRRKVGDSGVDPASNNVFGSKYWAGTAASENQVFCFYTTDGQSHVYQFHNSKGWGPLWTSVEGFSIKQMKYQNGVLWCSGHWGGDSVNSGAGALYALPLDTLKPVFVCWFRKAQSGGLNLQMQEMAGSYGNQIMIAAGNTGRIFVYDAEQDAVSMLDSIATSNADGEGTAPFTDGSDAGGVWSGEGALATDGFTHAMNHDRIGEMLTYGLWRYAMDYTPASTGTGAYPMLAYGSDEPKMRQASTAINDYRAGWESGDWDFKLPFEQKALMGFDVSYEPLTTGQSFEVWYRLDQGTWTQAGATQTSASADAAKGRTFITVSTGNDETPVGTGTKKFTSMRVRLVVKGARTAGSNYQPPVILGLNTEAQLITYDDVWDLALKIKNEANVGGVSDRNVEANKIRDWIWEQVNNHSVVKFLDGYVDRRPGVFNTWNVTIENPEDVIKRNGEGTFRISLRTIPD